MKPMLKQYLLMKGKHHTNINEFFAEIMTETKGNILQELLNEGFKNFNELNQFLLANQIKEMKNARRN